MMSWYEIIYEKMVQYGVIGIVGAPLGTSLDSSVPIYGTIQSHECICAKSLKEAVRYVDRHILRKKGKRVGKIISAKELAFNSYSGLYTYYTDYSSRNMSAN